MNEELVEKLVLQVQESLRAANEPTVFNYKFAELVVKECMKVVKEEYDCVREDRQINPNKWKQPVEYWDGYISCGVDCYVAIRQHFGIDMKVKQ